jgi:hypothetical protein
MNTIVYSDKDKFSIYYNSNIEYNNKIYENIYSLMNDELFLEKHENPVFDAMLLQYNQKPILRLKLKESKNYNLEGLYAKQLYDVRDYILFQDGEDTKESWENYIYMFKDKDIHIPSIKYIKFVKLKDFYFDVFEKNKKCFITDKYDTLNTERTYIHFIKRGVKYYYRDQLLATSNKKLDYKKL